MPLAGAIAINFSAPLLAALLSIVWLKERAGAARWFALLAGFCGVLIVANPGTDSLTLGALFALGNAMMYGSVTVAVRGMTATESANTLLMWQMLTIAVFHSLPAAVRLPHGRRRSTRRILVLSGVANAAGQYFWTRALQLAPADRGLAVLLPDAGLGADRSATSSGATCRRWDCSSARAIVVASGLFLLWHEGQAPTGGAPPLKPDGKGA